MEAWRADGQTACTTVTNGAGATWTTVIIALLASQIHDYWRAREAGDPKASRKRRIAAGAVFRAGSQPATQSVRADAKMMKMMSKGGMQKMMRV
jgi:hypothetical protein